MQLLDAIIALLLISGILIAIPMHPSAGMAEWQVFQKENDLLKAWLSNHDTSTDQMILDFKSIFPGFNGEIEWDKKTYSIQQNDSKNPGKIVSSRAFELSEHELTKIGVRVFMS